jgi:hypothetical protein
MRVIGIAIQATNCNSNILTTCNKFSKAAMSKVPDEAKSEDLLYEHFSEKDGIWFDFMADTGDGGNSSYTVACLLAQPSLKARIGGSKIVLPRGDFLLIGGDLA